MSQHQPLKITMMKFTLVLSRPTMPWDSLTVPFFSMARVYKSGLLIFWAVAEPWNSGKSAKSHEIHTNMQVPQHLLEILQLNVKYNIFENLSRLLGLFSSCKRANLSWNFITKTSKQRSKTTKCKLCCEKLGTSHAVKSFATGSFLQCFVVKIANDCLFYETLHRSFSSKICRENFHKIAIFY